jgi:glycosyltransferase involved in cell wall biosynthesis
LNILPLINSVLSQDFDDYEIIVKDGLSTDDTVKMVPQDERIRIIVEKDTGIYNAMNQAIEEAKGEYLFFLNCGDRLYSNDVLRTIAERMESESLTDCVVYGNCYIDNSGIEVKYPSKITKRFFQTRTICHQSAFIAKSLFSTIGLYDEQYKIVSDWKHFLEAYLNGANFVYVDKLICNYLGGGVSETKEGLEKIKLERKKIVAEKYSKKERFIMWCAKTPIGQLLIKIKNAKKREKRI